MTRDLMRDDLERLYYEEGLTLQQIGDRVGVSDVTVMRWMDEYDLDRRSSAEYKRVDYASFGLNNRGYERWQSSTGASGSDHVLVHRLAAVAWYGWDAVVDNDVHHENGVRWDNREDNLRPISPEEHGRIHIDPEMLHEARWGETDV